MTSPHIDRASTSGPQLPPPPRGIDRSAMRILFAGMAALLLFATPMDSAQAQDRPYVIRVTVGAFEDYEYRPIYGFHTTVHVRVYFSSRVVVTGVPQVALQIGTHTRYADFRPLDCLWPYGEKADDYGYLDFYYYVQATDLDTDGITLAAAGVSLNGGTIQSTAGSDANVSFSGLDDAPDARGYGIISIKDGRGGSLKVDGSLRQDKVVSPGPISICGSPKSGDTYKRGEKIWVRTESRSSSPVTVTGKPQVALQIGTQERQAVYDPVRSHPTELYFSYVVQAGDRDSDGVTIGANKLTLNGGSIVLRDGTTPANIEDIRISSSDRYRLTQQVDGSQEIQGRGPTAIRAAFTSAPADGHTYRRGEEILVTYYHDQAVVVTGAPQLTLRLGKASWEAVYDAERSEGTQVVFSYTVQADDYHDGYRSYDTKKEHPLSMSPGRYPVSLNGGRMTSADGINDANILRYEVSTRSLGNAPALTVEPRILVAGRTPAGAARIQAAGAIPSPVCG